MSSPYLQELEDGKDASSIILRLEAKLKLAHKAVIGIAGVLDSAKNPDYFYDEVRDLLDEYIEKDSSK